MVYENIKRKLKGSISMIACKIRIYPNKEQIRTINGTLGCCRYVYNMYIAHNIDAYKNGGKFVSGYDFSKYLNVLKRADPEYKWISGYSSKAVKDAIMRSETAFKRFFKKTSCFPRFKSRKRTNVESFYIVKDNIHYTKNKNIIKLPILGNVRITEYKYLPYDEDTITGGRIVREYGKYYVVLNYIPVIVRYSLPHNDFNIGIDLGLKHYTTIATDKHNPIKINHFKDTLKYKDINNRIERLQRIISKKAEINYKRLCDNYITSHNKEPNEKLKNIMKGESYNSSRIRNLRKKIRNLNARKSNIRKDYINKLVDTLTAKTKPSSITIENLDISEMIKHTNEHEKALHRYIGESGFYTFRLQLENKCFIHDIKLRIANKYFASSKTCSKCGHKKRILTLDDRVYICDECGLEIDRDINAAINLLQLPDDKCNVI